MGNAYLPTGFRHRGDCETQRPSNARQTFSRPFAAVAATAIGLVALPGVAGGVNMRVGWEIERGATLILAVISIRARPLIASVTQKSMLGDDNRGADRTRCNVAAFACPTGGDRICRQKSMLRHNDSGARGANSAKACQARPIDPAIVEKSVFWNQDLRTSYAPHDKSAFTIPTSASGRFGEVSVVRNSGGDARQIQPLKATNALPSIAAGGDASIRRRRNLQARLPRTLVTKIAIPTGAKRIWV